MAKLTGRARKALKSSEFVFPKTRKFPIEDKPHARNALSRAGAKGGAVEAKVRRAVKRKFPGIGEQHGPIDDMKKGSSHEEQPRASSGEGYGGRHHAQMGTMRVLGGACR